MEFIRPRFYRTLCFAIKSDEERSRNIYFYLAIFFVCSGLATAGVFSLVFGAITEDKTMFWIMTAFIYCGSAAVLYPLGKECAPLIHKSRLEVRGTPFLPQSIQNRLQRHQTKPVSYHRLSRVNPTVDSPENEFVAMGLDSDEGPPPYASREILLEGAVGGVGVVGGAGGISEEIYKESRLVAVGGAGVTSAEIHKEPRPLVVAGEGAVGGARVISAEIHEKPRPRTVGEEGAVGGAGVIATEIHEEPRPGAVGGAGETPAEIHEEHRPGAFNGSGVIYAEIREERRSDNQRLRPDDIYVEYETTV